VQITVAESVGLEGRAGYYDKAGALRDMVQNHLVQLLCLVAMEPPSSMDAEAVRDEKLKVLRSLEPITETMPRKMTVRGQYKAGASAGGAVKGYLEELEGGVSNTETFVAIKAEINNWRWAGRAVLSAAPASGWRAGLGNRRLLQAGAAFDLRRDCRRAGWSPTSW
jgi:glucose-6-phosphate 1-dehydrogenase